MHLAEGLSVHLRIGDDDATRNHGLPLHVAAVVPCHVYLRADESLDGLGVGLGTHDKHLVADVEHRVAGGNAERALVVNAGAHHVAVEKFRDLQQRSVGNIGVGHPERHDVRLGVRVLCLGFGELFLLFLEARLGDIADGDGRPDDAQHTQRIGAGIAVGNLWSVSIAEYGPQSLVGRTQSRRIGNGSIEGAHHHRQVDGIACVEEDVVASKHDQHVEQNGDRGKQVERNASLAEALEETGAHLQANTEHKENQPKVLHECQGGRGGREAHVSGQNAGKKHKGDAKRDAANLDLAQQYTDRDDKGIEQGNVRHGVLGREKFN